MTTLRKFGLPLLVLALLAFVIFDKCKPTIKPCDQCTTVTPSFIKTDSGLLVQPPALPDLIGTIMTVTRLSDSTLFLPVDTIDPGDYRLIPVNLDSTGINVQLEYLAPVVQPDNSIGSKYCKTSIDFPTTLGVIIMDVVMDHKSDMGDKGNLCTLNCSGTWHQETNDPSYTITIPYGGYEPGMVKYFSVNNQRFFVEFFLHTDSYGNDVIGMHLYECLGSGWTTSAASATSPVICSDGSHEFSISNCRDDGPNPLYIIIDATLMGGSSTFGHCTPFPQ